MSLGIRGRLFMVSVALILAFGSTSAVYLEFELRRWLEGRMESHMLGQARTALTTVELTPLPRDPAGVDAFVDRLGAATERRVTLIDADGVVLGDSALDADRVRALDNHGDRPEVAAAAQTGKGISRRFSDTLDTHMMYVAVPFERPAERGVVRLATPMSAVDETVGNMRVLLIVAGALGLVMATIMSLLASHLLSRRLRALLGRARAMADGHAPPVDPIRGDEIAGLDRSLKRLDMALEEVVATLAQERDRADAVLEGMLEAVIAVDADLMVTVVNRAGLALLELDAAPIGQPLHQVVRNPAIHRALEQALDGEARTLELDVPGVEGARHLLVQVTPQRSELGGVIVLHDVTRLRQLETMRRDFVANVSHELRTPISVIRLSAENLRDGAMNDPRHGPRFVDALLRNAERLGALIADLLDIARIESGQYPMRPEPIDLPHMTQRVIASVEQLATERGTRLAWDVPAALVAWADRKALDQVLVNLVQNAVKYSPEGSHVQVVGRTDADRVRVEVRDDGPGIPPEHRARIFERFYRVDAGRSKHMGGTGLGLAIVKHLVTRMSGRVGVEGNTPQGAVFWVELPVSEVAERRDEAA